ncbi:YHYH domain-containing protein [bacterium]|nr:YHYH domain-containing protein [bacterium]
MRLFSFILLLLSLSQAVFSHSGRTDSKGGHWDRKAGTYHYHNQGTTPRTSVPNSPKAYSESFYQELYAKKLGGRTEVTMPDGTRCDILTDTHAIEVDFADKWAEAIGQSLNYAMQTGKKAGIVLKLKDRGDEKHLKRLREMARHCLMDIGIFPHKAS